MDFHLYLQIISPVISPILVFLVVLLFFISFMLSGAQVAYFSLTIKDINVLKTRKQPSYRRIVDLLESPKSLYTEIVIANTIVNIAIILISSLLLDGWTIQLSLPELLLALMKVLIITAVLVIFGEILPRVWAGRHKIWFASTSSMVVELASSLLRKLSRQIVLLNQGIEVTFAGKEKHADHTSDEVSDLDLLDEDDASKDEKQILKGVVKFGNTTVKQTMRTRLDIEGIEITLDMKQVLEKVRAGIHSRLPVYNGNMDDIAGILYTKDLLPFIDEDASFDWQALLRPVFYVHEQKLIEDLLQEFKTKRIHLAVVVDEFGGTSGIITMEDVIEEIIGEIHDEFDAGENQNHQLDSHNFVFEGKTMIEEACRYMGLPGDTFNKWRGDSESVAGLLLEIAGDFPVVNSPLRLADFTFTPLQISKNRIIKVKITIPDVIPNQK